MKKIYQEITERIVEELKAGRRPWSQPWITPHGGSLRNYNTGRPYRGINTLLLGLSMQFHGFADPRWLTLKGANRLGGRVKKGAVGTRIVFWKVIEKPVADEENENGVILDEELGKTKTRKIFFFARYYTVFNAEQCEGLPQESENSLRIVHSEEEENALAEQIVDLLQPEHRGGGAFYIPEEDMICLPERNCFPKLGDYYLTLFHEGIHWTGHPARTGRHQIFANRFQNRRERAMEELVAEIGASFLGSAVGIPFEEGQHSEYIGEWLSALENDSRLIISMAAHAQKAADFILKEAGIKMDEDVSDHEIAEASVPF